MFMDTKISKYLLQVILFIIGLHYCYSEDGERPRMLDNCGIIDVYESRNDSEDSAELGDYPWMVIVRVPGTNYICGGAILNEHWIVTAANCILIHTKRLRTYHIYVGVQRTSEIHRMNAAKYQVSNVIVHEEFNASNSFPNNIALLRTKTPIDFEGSGGYVNGICLPETEEEPKGVAVLHGWEYKRKGGVDDTVMLKDIRVTLISRENCNELREDPYNEGNISDSQLCAVGASLCEFAYTGSPLTQETKSAANETGVHTLIGIVSYGSYCNNNLDSGVYTNVAAYMDWLYNMTGRNWTEGENLFPPEPVKNSGVRNCFNYLCSLIIVFIFYIYTKPLDL